MENKASQIITDHLKALWMIEDGAEGNPSKNLSGNPLFWAVVQLGPATHSSGESWPLKLKQSLERNPVKYSSK